MRLSILTTILTMTVLALPATAAASPPGASTGTATGVSDTAATLNGTVNPNKEATSYWFEYGTSPAYGAQTAVATAGGGNAGKSVTATLTGLTPSTTYHFRLVAQNASGTDMGADATFTTLAAGAGPPAAPAVTLQTSAPVVRFGRPVTLSGQVTGNNASGAAVTLEQTPAPFTSPFAPVGPAVSADAAGAFSLAVTPALNTRYRAEAKTSPPATSPTVDVKVRPAVGLRASDRRVRRGRRVRLSGSVAPAHDGLVVRLQRRIGTGRWRTIAKPTLRAAATAGRSAYRKRVRVRRTARYRVRLPAHADHAQGRSRKLRVVAR